MRTAFRIVFFKTTFAVGLSLALTACSGAMSPPDDIDGAQVSSVKTVRQTQEPTHQAQTTQTLDRVDTASADTVNVEESSSALAPVTVDQGINMDAGLGVEPERPVGLAEEQANQIAEGNTAQPVVGGVGTDQPMEMEQKSAPSNNTIPFDQVWNSTDVSPPIRKRDPEEETKVAYVPRLSDPTQIPETYGGLSAADQACRQDLENLGVRFKELSPISNGPTCGIAHPILVSGFSGGIELKPAAKLNCNVTRMFAKWVKSELVPSARLRYFSGIKTIYQMSSYSCRRMNSRSNNPWSEHARGNAIDIGKFVLKSGKEIDVRKKGFFAFREKGLLKTVRADSCRYFTTVLGPGDAYHGDHFHFDLRQRKKGSRYCSL